MANNATANRTLFTTLGLLLFATQLEAVELPPEQPLWPAGFGNPVNYDRDEVVRHEKAQPTAPSRSNRVVSFVSKPTYTIHQADPGKANGIGLVICPGGGYTDIWLDREGHDLAMELRKKGITSLVLKYRTNAEQAGQVRAHSWDAYLPAAESDARRGIHILRSRAAELNVKPDRIGISGFSAGGNLAIRVALFQPTPADSSGSPNFAGLFYPWLRADYAEIIKNNAANIPPLFIMNAVDDRVTPADKCLEFCSQLMRAEVPMELHLYNQGGHGFDLAVGSGESTKMWPTSFIAWLKDRGFEE